MPETDWTHLIEDARQDDVPAAVATVLKAFAGDQQMRFMFLDDRQVREKLMAGFFTILMSARLAIGMPVKVIRTNAGIGGVVFGYNTARPAWPDIYNSRWAKLIAGAPGLGERLGLCETYVDKFEPPSPHYYLGVLAVHPDLQGKGAGRALLEYFCGLSDSDPRSGGVYLETANPANVGYYQRNGFDLRGSGDLDSKTRINCLFRAKNKISI